MLFVHLIINDMSTDNKVPIDNQNCQKGLILEFLVETGLVGIGNFVKCTINGLHCYVPLAKAI